MSLKKLTQTTFFIFLFISITGENNAADQTRMVQDQMSGGAMAMPPDPKQAFKAEWEALEICDHQWALKNVENELIENQDVSSTNDD
jgi:protein pob